jgi:nucleoid-associated protein YgaU
VHELVAGDTLAGIAYVEYGNPNLWRAVAELNGIDDPMRLRPGQRLMLPTVETLATNGQLQADARRREAVDAAR